MNILNTLNLAEEFFNNFDGLFKTMSEPTKFPRYNVIKLDDSSFIIEIALAGYKREDVEVGVSNYTLYVTGKESSRERPDSKAVIHQGIMTSGFKRSWTLPRNIEVRNAKFEDGLLSIECGLKESEKPKLIPLN